MASIYGRGCSILLLMLYLRISSFSTDVLMLLLHNLCKGFHIGQGHPETSLLSTDLDHSVQSQQLSTSAVLLNDDQELRNNSK